MIFPNYGMTEILLFKCLEKVCLKGNRFGGCAGRDKTEEKPPDHQMHNQMMNHRKNGGFKLCNIG